MNKNIFGDPLIPCCTDPMTGYFRDGYCRTDNSDAGKHVVCAIMTDAFLAFSKAKGNDLSTPRPEHNFLGLVQGDAWCLCALRWKEAFDAGSAPLVKLEATAEESLRYIDINDLVKFAQKTIGKDL